MIKIRRGLDIPLAGAPEQVIAREFSPRHVALVGADYVGMKPTMTVAEGDTVAQGQVIFTDKKCEGVAYTAPASGRVSAINRGARRVFQSLVIEVDDAAERRSWGAIGAAMDCYDTALRYSKERIQFDKPIAAFQLQQKKLAEMITEITKAQFLTWRLGVLRNEGRATSAHISMCKRNNVEMALNITREARQMLGAMGITGEYPVMRHMMNLESVVTYEGTHDIHLLITGLDITGENAFK